MVTASRTVRRAAPRRRTAKRAKDYRSRGRRRSGATLQVATVASQLSGRIVTCSNRWWIAALLRGDQMSGGVGCEFAGDSDRFLAIQAQRGGNLGAAEEIYSRVLAASPENPDALHFSGLLAIQRGRAAEGMQLVARSIELAPQHPDFLSNYGNLLRDAGRFSEAADAYHRVIASRPDFADALPCFASHAGQ